VTTALCQFWHTMNYVVLTMRKSNRERQQADGWRFGTTQDFLGLSDEESAYIELRLGLANSLRLRRQRQKLSRAELARRVGSSQSRIAKMEGGDTSVSLDLLIRALLALGASTSDLARAISG
jgi:DNA-binding XRE family transcriptional regulator